MNPTVKKILRMLMLVLFLISTVLLAGKLKDGAQGDSDYDAALAMTRPQEQLPQEAAPETQASAEPVWVPAPVEEEDEYLEAVAAMDLDALRQQNPDVIGWILLPDTDINYPIMQGTDNEYYLKHTWLGEKNAVGSIFMEWRNQPDFSEYNTILYGHNMINGSMFSDLRRYAGERFGTSHPYVYIATDDGAFRYEIFSAYQATLGSATYGLSFHQEETKKEFLIHTLHSSNYDMGIAPETTDRVLTLSTCSGADSNSRWVVHARLKMVQLSPAAGDPS